jgi:hypothetical protein
MSILGSEQVLFTVANPALIGPSVDAIVIRSGTFTTLSSSTLLSTTATFTNVTATNLTTGTLVVGNLGANSVNPSVPGDGVTIDGVLIRDRLIGIDPTRSVSSVEGVNLAPVNGVSVALIPRGAGGILAAYPDGTAAGGNVRGDFSVDLQMGRLVAASVASGSLSVIGGGYNNVATSTLSVIGGGSSNQVAGGGNSVISGGANNIINGAATHGAIVGGSGNVISGGSYGVAGGLNNTVSNTAAVAFGQSNNVTAARSMAFGSNCQTASVDCVVIGTGATTVASNQHVFQSMTSGAATASGTYTLLANYNRIALNVNDYISMGTVNASTRHYYYNAQVAANATVRIALVPLHFSDAGYVVHFTIVGAANAVASGSISNVARSWGTVRCYSHNSVAGGGGMNTQDQDADTISFGANCTYTGNSVEFNIASLSGYTTNWIASIEVVGVLRP